MTDAGLGRVLTALAEPSRRQMVELLRERARSAGELAQAAGLTPAAASRHLRALRDAGIVSDAHPAFDARVRIYSLRAGGLTGLKAWVDETEALWADQLAAFKAHVEAEGEG
ncbi:MAG: transcriptional regulator [Caulobacterales bacterium 32-69-10]|nr:MAG: transcriptional regulator [Caulobacterales bacterium 32-69-10]